VLGHRMASPLLVTGLEGIEDLAVTGNPIFDTTLDEDAQISIDFYPFTVSHSIEVFH